MPILGVVVVVDTVRRADGGSMLVLAMAVRAALQSVRKSGRRCQKRVAVVVVRGGIFFESCRTYSVVRCWHCFDRTSSSTAQPALGTEEGGCCNSKNGQMKGLRHSRDLYMRYGGSSSEVKCYCTYFSTSTSSRLPS